MIESPDPDVMDGTDRLMTPGQVAKCFAVDAKTVTRWAAAGRIDSIRTPGGHRRFRASTVRALLALPYADRPGYREEWRP